MSTTLSTNLQETTASLSATELQMLEASYQSIDLADTYSFLNYGVDIQTEERQYRYFVYEAGEQVYIESPYEGIYKAEHTLFSIVLKYFEEG